jgi:hypothetical protein
MRHCHCHEQAAREEIFVLEKETFFLVDLPLANLLNALI